MPVYKHKQRAKDAFLNGPATMVGPAPTTPHVHDFSDDYRERLFLLWYKMGKPEITAFVKNAPPDEQNENKVPKIQTLHTWSRERDWIARADALDAQVSREVENLAIQEKVEMFKRHAQVGKELMDKGIAYLNDAEHGGIDSANAALRAIFDGAELEKQSRGVPQALLRLADMSDTQLANIIETLIGGRDVAQLLDGGASEEVIDGEMSEVEE